MSTPTGERAMRSGYLDLEAAVGISKHLGGIPASRRLLEACRVAAAREVLEVGCGVGIEAVRIARAGSSRVVALDVSPEMLRWTDRRARAAGVRDRLEIVQGDVRALPFVDGRFDAVICESVLAFVGDKETAIREMVRVTRPGGWIGLNEGMHLASVPSPKVDAMLGRLAPQRLLTLDAWRALWARSGLEERSIAVRRLDPARELRDRLRWIGVRSLVGALVRGVRLYLTRPELRAVVNTMAWSTIQRTEEPNPADRQVLWAAVGYGLLVGRKPG